MDIEIISSYYGVISRIGDPAVKISVIGEDGRLMEDRWSEMCRRTADNGAAGIREMPFWLVRHEDHVFAPYCFGNGTYDLDRFNPLYFQNLRRVAEIANRFSLKFYLSIYEHCNIRPRNGKREFVPWTNCKQRLSDAWYGEDAAPYRDAWERKVLSVLDGLNAGYELCNEPDGDFERFLMLTYKHLSALGVKDNDILTGVEFSLDDNKNRRYRQFKKLLKDTYGVDWYHKQKHIWFTVIHNMSPADWKELELQEGHTRRFWLSVDGLHPKPGKEWWKRYVETFLTNAPKAPFKNKYAFETMHKRDEDDFDDVLGIVEAVHNVTGEYPPNYRRFPEPSHPVIKPPPIDPSPVYPQPEIKGLTEHLVSLMENTPAEHLKQVMIDAIKKIA